MTCSTSWYYHFGCVQPGIAKVLKTRSLHVFAISPEKDLGEVDFLPANKHESFLQVDSITLGLVARHAQSTQNNKFTMFL